MSFAMTKCSPHRFILFAIFFPFLLWPSVAQSQPDDDKENSRVRWAIALHGGAGSLPRPMDAEQEQLYRAALTAALRSGKDVLVGGGTAVDAVTATVVELENCPLFNAGKGAVFNHAGQHELDASIMDGATLETGAVAIVKQIKNPIVAARLVMEKTPHVLVAGDHLRDFAAAHEYEIVEQSYFYTKRRFLKLQTKLRAKGLPVLDKPGYEHRTSAVEPESSVPLSGDSGTVGCVALDVRGRLAAATSTGGLNGKMPGRIGDSPICGAGNYANSQVAVGGTGKGEEFIRHTIAAKVAWLMESRDLGVHEAVNYCLHKVLKKGDGGLIAVDSNGNLAMHSTTSSLPRGAADSTGRFEVGIWIDEP